MHLRHYRRDLDDVFCILGKTENAITQSIAWTLSQCPTLLSTLMGKIAPEIRFEALQIATQSFGSDRGFTDIEIYDAGVVHVIVEAKIGWSLPQVSQFRRYLPRFNVTQAPRAARFLVSMSEASDLYASLHLPRALEGAPIIHINWRSVLGMVTQSHSVSRSQKEKMWLAQLSSFLGGIAGMQNQRSNEVFVVSLGAQEIAPGYSWIDVVEKDGVYFHPIGKQNFPAEPVNYIGFRYRGRLQSIHHVKGFEVVTNLRKQNKKWPTTHVPHFVYKLSKAIRPATLIATGKIYRGGHARCLIDTLLSGEYASISEARDASKQRLAQLES